MKNLIGYFIAGLVGTLAGAVYGSLAFARPPFGASTVDLGQMSLNQTLNVLIPVTNAHPYRSLTLTDISSSCGCAKILVTRLEVPPRSIEWLPVIVLPKPPETRVDFTVGALVNGETMTRIAMRGRITEPFEGYPTHVASRTDGRGRVISVRTASLPIDRVILYDRSSTTALSSYWDSALSEIVCPECGPDADLDLVIWSFNQSEPAWSGPVTLQRHTESHQTEDQE